MLTQALGKYIIERETREMSALFGLCCAMRKASTENVCVANKIFVSNEYS